MSEVSDVVRVLHVDDDGDFRTLTADLLEAEADVFTVESVSSAAAGIDRLAEDTFDCIVSDYEMPGRDGIEFLSAVREEYPDLPFVLFTGKGSEDVAGEAIAAGVTDYIQKGGGLDQFTLLANRIQNAVDAYRARRDATRHERISTLVRDINRKLVEAESVEAIEQAVCETITTSDQYLFAWIGEPDPDGDEIVPRTSAGSASDYLASVTINYTDDPAGNGPGGRAVRTRETQVVQSIRADPSFEQWRDTAERYGYESVVVLPLLPDGDLHGILAIYADRPHAFDEAEQAVLEELAETVGRAIAAVRARRDLERFRTIVQALGDPVYTTDSDGIYTFVNQAYADLTGYGRESMIGRPAWEILDAPSYDRATDAVATLLSADDDCTQQTYEVTIETAEGDTVECEDNVSLLPSEDGEYRGAAGVVRDITARKRRERDRIEANTVLRTILDNLTAGLLVEDADRNILLANNRFCEMLGLSADAEDIVGRDCRTAAEEAADLFADPEAFVDDIETIIEDRTPIRNAELELADGRTLARDYVPYSMLDGEANLWVYRDVTDRKERERALEHQNERLDEFVSVVSHDLRNPLQVVMARMNTYRQTGDEAHLDVIERNHDRMAQLVDDLETLAREGQSAADVEPVDLARAVTLCWQSVATDDATLTVETDLTIRAEESRLQQLLENLIGNAVEHGSTGSQTQSDDAVEHGSTSPDSGTRQDDAASGPTVTVGDLPDGFYVADDGSGIPEEAEGRLFETGFSLSDSGTGFGLSIVQQIADAHGWVVRATESESGGARFEVTGVDRVD